MVEIGLGDHLKVQAFLQMFVCVLIVLAEQQMQALWVVLFRPDLHQELQRLAFEIDHRTVVPELKLSAKVVSVVRCIARKMKQPLTNGSKDIKSAKVILEDGSTYDADLVVGADGEKVC